MSQVAFKSSEESLLNNKSWSPGLPLYPGTTNVTVTDKVSRFLSVLEQTCSEEFWQIGAGYSGILPEVLELKDDAAKNNNKLAPGGERFPFFF
jgi:hypothetical protein